MDKQSFFVPRPDSINAINPNAQKRIQTHPHKATNMVGASRMDSEWGVVVDKIASYLTKLPALVGPAKERLIVDAARKGIKVVEKDGRMYYELGKDVAEGTKATDAYGFIGKKKLLDGAGFSKKGFILTDKAQAILEKL